MQIFLPKDCLDCWNRLCKTSGAFPADCAHSPNDSCIDYGGADRNGSALHSNKEQCCVDAGGYVETVVQNIPQQSPNGDQDSCTTAYNEQSEDNFDTNNFDTISPSTQYVFPSIQFGCKGCISNITFYTNSSQQLNDTTMFNILLWRYYNDNSSNSSMLVLGHNYSVNVTEPFVYIPWSGSSHSTTISLNYICFDPGHIFGLSIPGSEAFNLDVLSEKPGSASTVVYRRSHRSCDSLGKLFSPQSSESGGNILIAVRVSTVSMVTTSTVTSSSK